MSYFENLYRYFTQEPIGSWMNRVVASPERKKKAKEPDTPPPPTEEPKKPAATDKYSSDVVALTNVYGKLYEGMTIELELH